MVMKLKTRVFELCNGKYMNEREEIKTMPSQSYQGLQGQIRYMEDNIAIKKKLGKDSSFEEGLVKEWKKYLPGGSKHHLWLDYSREGSHKKR